MNNAEERIIDQHTVADLPIEIYEIKQIPQVYQDRVLNCLKGNLKDYTIIFAPACRMIKDCRDYLFAYGQDEVFFFYPELDQIKDVLIKRKSIFEVATRKELLDAEIIIKHPDNKIVLPYVPSSYYLYDPFLNWLIGLDKDFSPVLVERENPRPRELYHDSLTMFNYSLAAYRLGKSFKEYNYDFERKRKKWMPWKSTLEEWLVIAMERGTFHLHSFGYLTECTYKLI